MALPILSLARAEEMFKVTGLPMGICGAQAEREHVTLNPQETPARRASCGGSTLLPRSITSASPRIARVGPSKPFAMLSCRGHSPSSMPGMVDLLSRRNGCCARCCCSTSDLDFFR